MHLLRTGSAPSLFDFVANLDRKVGLRLCKGLWTVLVSKVCLILLLVLSHQLSDQASVIDREGDRLFFRVAEDDLSEQRSGGVIHVDDDVFCACHRFKGPFDEVGSRGREDLGDTVN